MLNTVATTVLTQSRPPLTPLNVGDTYSSSRTNKNQFQTITISKASAYPSGTLYQPPIAANESPLGT